MNDIKPELFKKRDEINKLLKSNRVVLAYLFGSQVSAETTVLSDVDIAVLFSATVDRNECGKRQIKLMTEFSHLFNRQDIDVVVLNTSSPLVRYKATGGYLFFCCSEKERIEFQVKAFRDYFDTEAIRQVQWNAYKRILKGRAS
jgi:predicted nucleotidyltransferase